MWVTWIAFGAIVLILTGAIIKIVLDKKKGVKCIGCPAAHSCAMNGQRPCSSRSYHESS